MLTCNSLKWIGVDTPPAKKHAQTDGLERSGKSANSNGVQRTLFGKYLRDELYTSGVSDMFALN